MAGNPYTIPATLPAPTPGLNLPVQYLDSTLGLLATGIYDVARPLAPTLVNGVETDDPSPTIFQVQAVVNPLAGIDLKRLPEGRRSTDFRQVFTSVALNTASDTYGADQIYIGPDVFEVQESNLWQMFGNVWVSIGQRNARLNQVGGGG